MKAGVIIRKYQEKDKPAVLNLFRLNTPGYFSPAEENDLLYYLSNEIEQYFVLEYGNEIVGCGGINFSNNLTTGKISWDIFHPDYQGKGFGSSLLTFRIEKLKALPHLQTISVRTSQLAYKFYEKNNFKLLEVVKDYWAAGYDLYRMEYER